MTAEQQQAWQVVAQTVSEVVVKAGQARDQFGLEGVLDHDPLWVTLNHLEKVAVNALAEVTTAKAEEEASHV